MLHTHIAFHIRNSAKALFDLSSIHPIVYLHPDSWEEGKYDLAVHGKYSFQDTVFIQLVSQQNRTYLRNFCAKTR